MMKSRFQVLLDDTFRGILKLTATKGEEYTNSDEDQLANFRRLSLELDLPMEKVLSVYLTKHLDSIKSYIRQVEGGGKFIPSSEPIEGRIDDAILYLLLLKAIIVERKEEELRP